MNYEPEFKGYWSERDKELWHATDWRARGYEDLPVEGDTFEGTGYFYVIGTEVVKKRITFQKYLRANSIYSPYYGPVYDSQLKEYMKENSFLTAMYDGTMEGNYPVHDRFETSELYDVLSR